MGSKVFRLFISKGQVSRLVNLLNVLSVNKRVVRCPRVRRITTVCGVIRVERWVYRCASGHNHVPWEVEQKLRGQYTHRVAEAMCRMASCFDFRAAAKELFRQGIQVSHTTLQKVREWSEALSVSEQVEPQTLDCDGM